MALNPALRLPALKVSVVHRSDSSGTFVDPSSDSFQAAAASADWSSPDFYQLLTAAPGIDSWPITATTFALMQKNPKNLPR